MWSRPCGVRRPSGKNLVRAGWATRPWVSRVLSGMLLAAACFSSFEARAQTTDWAHADDWPQAHSDLKADPAVRFATLPNGMRYAIMRNATPKGEVAIRFRIAAGSLDESEAQQGLAHFTEHMAFRG